MQVECMKMSKKEVHPFIVQCIITEFHALESVILEVKKNIFVAPLRYQYYQVL